VTANSELLADLPLAAAVALAFAGGRRTLRWGAAGLFAGLAALIRPQAAVAGPALALAALLAHRFRTRGWADAAALAGGMLLPLAAVAGLFAALGRLPELWDWTVLRNLAYPPPSDWLPLLL